MRIAWNQSTTSATRIEARPRRLTDDLAPGAPGAPRHRPAAEMKEALAVLNNAIRDGNTLADAVGHWARHAGWIHAFDTHKGTHRCRGHGGGNGVCGGAGVGPEPGPGQLESGLARGRGRLSLALGRPDPQGIPERVRGIQEDPTESLRDVSRGPDSMQV